MELPFQEKYMNVFTYTVHLPFRYFKNIYLKKEYFQHTPIRNIVCKET